MFCFNKLIKSTIYIIENEERNSLMRKSVDLKPLLNEIAQKQKERNEEIELRNKFRNSFDKNEFYYIYINNIIIIFLKFIFITVNCKFDYEILKSLINIFLNIKKDDRSANNSYLLSWLFMIKIKSVRSLTNFALNTPWNPYF